MSTGAYRRVRGKHIVANKLLAGPAGAEEGRALLRYPTTPLPTGIFSSHRTGSGLFEQRHVSFIKLHTCSQPHMAGSLVYFSQQESLWRMVETTRLDLLFQISWSRRVIER